ncbi:hypothetical protein Nepgr_001283 [Nepenthes gracilis]|uniref:Shugoshin C-terminal domain-containing protein n=1 Tax=Nepenthes gracilis TaxID=150966 RepID=A0AAD3P457_NEPGR|nr:hypothetical protein Nepgr_001283 [Nepenthes gracilis]
MEDIFVFNTGNDAIPGTSEGDKELWRSSVGGTPRKGLLDITNLPSQKPRLSNLADKSKSVSVATKEPIDRLLKEKLALMKQIADRNKIIELSGIELQKLRVNLQKAQQQNCQLAQANSEMLAELNTGKDKLKELRHNLGCMKSLLIVKNLELQEKKNAIKHRQAVVKASKIQTTKSEAGESSHDDNNCSKTCRQVSKVAFIANGAVTKEKAEDKRLNFKEPESTEDLFEMDDAKFPVCPQLNDGKHDSTPLASSGTDCDTEKENANESVAQGIRRSSLGRPLRRAAEKVQSYKEIPVNKKMRR